MSILTPLKDLDTLPLFRKLGDIYKIHTPNHSIIKRMVIEIFLTKEKRS